MTILAGLDDDVLAFFVVAVCAIIYVLSLMLQQLAVIAQRYYARVPSGVRQSDDSLTTAVHAYSIDGNCPICLDPILPTQALVNIPSSILLLSKSLETRRRIAAMFFALLVYCTVLPNE